MLIKNERKGGVNLHHPDSISFRSLHDTPMVRDMRQSMLNDQGSPLIPWQDDAGIRHLLPIPLLIDLLLHLSIGFKIHR